MIEGRSNAQCVLENSSYPWLQMCPREQLVSLASDVASNQTLERLRDEFLAVLSVELSTSPARISDQWRATTMLGLAKPSAADICTFMVSPMVSG